MGTFTIRETMPATAVWIHHIEADSEEEALRIAEEETFTQDGEFTVELDEESEPEFTVVKQNRKGYEKGSHR